MLEKIFDVIKSNLKNPKLYIFILVILLCVLLLFPYIDANVFYYQRVKNRIEILTTISGVDVNQLSDNQILLEEYNRILSEIEKQANGSLSSVFTKESDPIVNHIKFFTGAILFWIIAFLCFFIKGFDKNGYRVIGFFVFLLLGGLFGLMAKALPTIIAPVFNYIGFPLVLIILIALLSTIGKKKA